MIKTILAEAHRPYPDGSVFSAQCSEVVELATRLSLEQEILGSNPSLGTKPLQSQIVPLLEAGRSYREIVAQLGCSKSTISYHARKLGRAKDGKQYDWAAIQSFHDAGNGRRACQQAFGFSSDAWHLAVKRGALVPREWRIPLAELLSSGRCTQRSHLKIRLLNAGLLTNVCHECGLSEWRGKPLSLALHHVNGIGTDNRLENLQLLCPNCHSQTPNFAGRNKARPKT